MGVLEGKIALVTGAASGIGRSTAEVFAKEGASHVALIDVDEQGILSTSEIVRNLNKITLEMCIIHHTSILCCFYLDNISIYIFVTATMSEKQTLSYLCQYYHVVSYIIPN